MALSDAERQKRRRGKLKRQMQTDPRTIEAALLAEAEREEMSDRERVALADKIADLAKDHLWRAHELSQIAYRLRTGEEHPRREDKQ
jgi:hypothetical protein